MLFLSLFPWEQLPRKDVFPLFVYCIMVKIYINIINSTERNIISRYGHNWMFTPKENSKKIMNFWFFLQPVCSFQRQWKLRLWDQTLQQLECRLFDLCWSLNHFFLLAIQAALPEGMLLDFFIVVQAPVWWGFRFCEYFDF